jgi:hypothetical protein
MTTYTIYANTNDHYVSSNNTTYSTARSGGTLSDDTTNDQWDGAQWIFSGTTYYCFEYFVSFDTSAIPAGTPALIQLKQTVGSLVSAPSQTINYAQSAWSGGTGDWIAGASLPTAEYAISVENATAAGTQLSSTSAPSDIPRSATYELVGYSSLLKAGTAPTTGTLARLRTTKYTGTASDPVLVVIIATHSTVTAAGGSFTLNGASGVAALSSGGTSYAVPTDVLSADGTSYAVSADALSSDDTSYTISSSQSYTILRYGRHMAAAAGSFVVAGQDAILTSVRAMASAFGSFALTGRDAALLFAGATSAIYGSFELAGQAALMGIRRFPPIDRVITFISNRLDTDRTLEL